MEAKNYKKLWTEQSLHPLQSEEWAQVYPNTTQYVVAGMPTLVQLGNNPLNKRPFATIIKCAYDGKNVEKWAKALLIILERDFPRLSHVTIEPNGKVIDLPSSWLLNDVDPTTMQNTVINSLSGTEDELLATSSKSHRQNIRKSFKKGLIVDVYTEGQEAIDRFIKVMTNMQTSKSFLQFSPAHYRKVWELMSNSGLAYITVGQFEGQDIGTYLVAHNSSTAYQFYGGRTEIGRREKLAQGLAFKTMLAAKNVGCSTYDMWGVGKFDENGLIESDEKYGIGKFKLAFGGTIFAHSDTATYVFDKKAYKTYKTGKKAAKLKLKIVKKLKR